MRRYLIDVYALEIPDNGQRRDDLAESTEDWLGKLGRGRCYQFQMQGGSLSEIGKRLLQRPPNEKLTDRGANNQ